AENDIVEGIAETVGSRVFQREVLDIGARVREIERNRRSNEIATLPDALDDLVAVIVDEVSVVAGAALEQVVAGAAEQTVVTFAADQRVVACIAGNDTLIRSEEHTS